MFPSHQTAPLFLKQNLTLFKVIKKCNFQCINFNLCFIQYAKNKTKPTFLITSIPLPSSPTTPGYPKSNFYFPLSFQPSPFQALNPKVEMSLSMCTFQTRSGVSFPPTLPEVSLHLFTSCCERLGTC